MVAEIRDPTGDTGKGAGEMVPETQRDRTMGTAQDSVADAVVTVVGEMEITAEAEVHKGGMVTTTTPPPTKTGRKCGTAVRTVGKEVGWRRRNNSLRGWGKGYL